MELRKLIKNTSFLIGTRFVQFLTGILRAKISAIYLGTSGVGVFTQLTFLTEKMSLFTSLSMNEAVVKQIAENSDHKEIRKIICSSLKIYIVLLFSFMTLSIVLLYIFSENISYYVFGDIKYLQYFFIALFSYPLLLLNSIPFAILKGFKSIKLIARARIGITILNITIFVPLVVFYELRGAVIFVPISYLITFGFNYYFARKNHLRKLDVSFRDILKATYNAAFFKEMLVFSGFGLTVNLWIIISEFICRAIVVSNLGVDSIGLYSPIIAWAGLFTGFLLPTFNTYLFPRFCEAGSKEEVCGILNDALRFSTLLLLPLLFLGIPYRHILIQLMYSKEFLPAADYLPFHFVGVVFFVWWYLFTQSMTPRGYIRQHGAISILFYLVNIIVVYALIPKIGLYGFMLKHIISPVIFFFVYYYFLKKKLDFHIAKKNLRLMLYLLFGAFLLIFLDLASLNFALINYSVSAFLLVFSIQFTTKNERKFVLNQINRFNGKNNH